jgi:hypothetical protein
VLVPSRKECPMSFMDKAKDTAGDLKEKAGDITHKIG